MRPLTFGRGRPARVPRGIYSWLTSRPKPRIVPPTLQSTARRSLPLLQDMGTFEAAKTAQVTMRDSASPVGTFTPHSDSSLRRWQLYDTQKGRSLYSSIVVCMDLAAHQVCRCKMTQRKPVRHNAATTLEPEKWECGTTGSSSSWTANGEIGRVAETRRSIRVHTQTSGLTQTHVLACVIIRGAACDGKYVLARQNCLPGQVRVVRRE